MKTIEIKLAGILFKVDYQEETHMVYEVERHDPHSTSGWVKVSKSTEDHLIEHHLTDEVIIAREEGVI
jgi:hypothetical protein